MFGGVSATHIDTTMVPYFRYSFHKHFKDGLKYVENRCNDFNMTDEQIRSTSIDDGIYSEHYQAYQYALDMTTKDTYQAVEALLHNLNSLQSRSGGQLPFTSINYGLCVEHEGRIVTRAILDTTIKGLGEHGRTSIFPCQIFQCKTGVNRYSEDPNYDLYQLALESTAKRIYPNYVNCDWSVQKDWVNKDREMREDVIEEFGDELVVACEQHPEWMKTMRLEWDSNGCLAPAYKVDPREEASTMGKGNYSSSKTM